MRRNPDGGVNWGAVLASAGVGVAYYLLTRKRADKPVSEAAPLTPQQEAVNKMLLTCPSPVAEGTFPKANGAVLGSIRTTDDPVGDIQKWLLNVSPQCCAEDGVSSPKVAPSSFCSCIPATYKEVKKHNPIAFVHRKEEDGTKVVGALGFGIGQGTSRQSALELGFQHALLDALDNIGYRMCNKCGSGAVLPVFDRNPVIVDQYKVMEYRVTTPQEGAKYGDNAVGCMLFLEAYPADIRCGAYADQAAANAAGLKLATAAKELSNRAVADDLADAQKTTGT